MEFVKTEIEGVMIIEPRVFGDERGCVFESFSQKELEKIGINTVFVQDNESKSCYGVVRGRVLDAAVDIHKGSPTYGKHVTCELSEDNHRMFFIPLFKDFNSPFDFGKI